MTLSVAGEDLWAGSFQAWGTDIKDCVTFGGRATRALWLRLGGIKKMWNVAGGATEPHLAKVQKQKNKQIKTL